MPRWFNRRHRLSPSRPNRSTPGRTRLRHEPLEARWVLSSMPVLNVVDNQQVDEGESLSITDLGTFTDVVELESTGGPASAGLDPDNFTSLGSYNPTGTDADLDGEPDPIFINTDTLSISGFGGTGTTVEVDAGDGEFEVAVFTFDHFQLDSDLTLVGEGSRPLAILSQGDIVISGTIDVSAVLDTSSFFFTERFAGPGGGNGGTEGTEVDDRTPGDPAAGAPLSSRGQWAVGSSGAGSGTGGGHGGDGGKGEIPPSSAFLGPEGLAFGAPDMSDMFSGVRGGSGGGSSGVETDSGFFVSGGGGGGGIELGAVGQVTITSGGEVLANGGAGGGSGVVAGGGGGAGGGILVHADTLSMDGTLSATGGPGGNGVRDGGGGGGGRVLMAYTSSGSVGGTVDVTGGLAPGTNNSPGQDGLTALVQVAPPEEPVIESYDFVIDWGDDSPLDTGPATIDVAGTDEDDIVEGSFDGSHVYADNGVYTVTVSVISDTGDDPSETTDTATFQVTVDNLAPELSNVTTDATTLGSAGEGDVIILTADFTDAGVLDTHTASIDWGDDSTSAGTVDQGAGTVLATHTYSQGGTFDVTLTLVDNDSGEAMETTVAVISGVGVQDGVLQVVGTTGNDTAQVYFRQSDGTFHVVHRLDNGSLTVENMGSSVNSIDMILGDGDDFAFVSQRVDVDAFIDGGAGDDMLLGGDGNDILIGGEGFDLLYGGNGRDLIIGGADGDLIVASGGEDILIAGTTAFDSNREALDLLMLEWTSDRSYSDRVDNITGTGSGTEWDARLNEDYFLVAEGEDATVFDDEAQDWLVGGSGLDLYFAGEDDFTLSSFFEVVEETEAQEPV